MEINEKNFLEVYKIPTIEDKNYWLVRTNSGKYYKDFVANDYIAIGWDYVSIKDISTLKDKELRSRISRYEKTTKSNDEIEATKTKDGRITAIISKLHRFIIELKIGDVVIIPDKNSENFAIGTISSEPFEDPNHAENYVKEHPGTTLTLCPYLKRRKVKWEKFFRREDADIYLLKAFSSHHAISDINIYAPYINRNVHDVYIEDNTLHATIKAGTEENLSFKELKEIVDLIDSTIHYCFPDDYEEISKKLDVKLNIHCPGIIEFIMAGSFFLFTFSIALMQINHFINGGEIKADFSVDLIKQSASASFSSSSKGIRGRNIEEKGLDQRHELSLKAQELAKTTNLQLPSFELNPEVEEPVDEEVNE